MKTNLIVCEACNYLFEELWDNNQVDAGRLCEDCYDYIFNDESHIDKVRA